MDYKTIIAVLLVFAFVGGVAAEDSLPLLPDEFRGSVTINGNPAAVGTVLTALIDGEVRGTVTTTETGIYGGLELDDRRLIVTGYDGEVGTTITFTVGGHTAKETSTFRPGETQCLNLSATYTPPSPPSGGGGGGGSGGLINQPPVVSPDAVPGEAVLTTSSTGNLLGSVTVSSVDKKASLYLPKGTGVLDSAGKPLSAIHIEEVATLPAVPGGFTFEGYSCECKPAGATFSPAITISFSIPADEWVEGKAYTIKCYNAATGLWETLETTVNAATHTVSAKVSHFSCFALFTESATVATATKAPISATAVPTTTSAAIPAASGSPEAGTIPWMTILVVCIVVGVVAGGAYYLKKE
jgi:hypothetical protein